MAVTGERGLDERDGKALAERGRAVDAAILAIEKQFGRGSIMKLGSAEKLQVEAIPTGSIALVSHDREIEESISSHPNIAEVAVVGVADQLKGQVAMAFAIAKDASGLSDAAARLKLEGEVMKLVDQQLGAVARPARVLFVTALPKTRSGKLLRRAIQAVCERRDAGDLTTMEDPSALQQIKDLIG